jgi:hypothetical protein
MCNICLCLVALKHLKFIVCGSYVKQVWPPLIYIYICVCVCAVHVPCTVQRVLLAHVSSPPHASACVERHRVDTPAGHTTSHDKQTDRVVVRWLVAIF